MAYKPLELDRKNLTIMGVKFPDKETFEQVSCGLGTNMFEGFEPTPHGIEIIRNYVLNKITIEKLLELAKNNAYA
jgi:putative transcriptional regulator